MKTNNKKCLVCGSIYTYCSNCSQYAYLPKWKNLYDTENCKEIFYALSNHSYDKDKEKAKKRLDGLDLSNKASFLPNIVSHIDEIYADEPTGFTTSDTNSVIKNTELVQKEYDMSFGDFTVSEKNIKDAEDVIVSEIGDNSTLAYFPKKKKKKNK